MHAVVPTTQIRSSMGTPPVTDPEVGIIVDSRVVPAPGNAL